MPEIKNLTFIHLYNKYDREGNFPALKIKVDGTQIICDYTNPIFLELLKKVWEEYQKNPQIIVLGDFTKETVSKFLEIGKYKIDVPYTQDKSLFNTDKGINKIKKYESYLKQIIKTIIRLNTEDSIIFGNIHGHKNKCTISYQINGIEKNLTFIYTLEENKLLFKTSYIDNQILPITGEIEIRYDRVFIKWTTSDNSLQGITVHCIDEEENENYIQTSKGSINQYTQVKLTQKEIELINFYLELCGFSKYDKLIKTTENSYLFLAFNTYDNEVCTLISGHINIYENKIIITYKKENGNSSYLWHLFIPVESYQIETTIIPVDKENILIENYFSQTKTSTCEYKTYEHKYTYELIKAEYKTLKQPFTYKKYSFLGEVNTLDDIKNTLKKPKPKEKKLIKRRGENVPS